MTGVLLQQVFMTGAVLQVLQLLTTGVALQVLQVLQVFITGAALQVLQVLQLGAELQQVLAGWQQLLRFKIVRRPQSLATL
jgi:hypothetical protein